MGDAPPCDKCGSITIRNGTCYRCPNLRQLDGLLVSGRPLRGGLPKTTEGYARRAGDIQITRPFYAKRAIARRGRALRAGSKPFWKRFPLRCA